MWDEPGIGAGWLSRGLFTTMEMRWKLNSDWTNLLNYDWYEIVTKYYLVIFGSEDFIDPNSLRLSSIPVSSFAKEALMGAVLFEGRIGGGRILACHWGRDCTESHQSDTYSPNVLRFWSTLSSSKVQWKIVAENLQCSLVQCMALQRLAVQLV